MITYTTGDILDSDAEALVNTVNTVGVMGKGIALQFKMRYPTNYSVYRRAVEAGEVQTGELLIVDDADQRGARTIINFPTKQHWRQPSKYDYIERGLEALRSAILERGINSVAIPPLGCGHGGLDWAKVRPMITQALDGVPAHFIVFEPNDHIARKLRTDSRPLDAPLTPARGMLLEAQYAYEREGDQTSLFVATKLAYFLQRLGEPLGLEFKPHIYGPYDQRVAHVMQHLNGSYLTGMEQGPPRPFEPIYLNYARQPDVRQYIKDHLRSEQRERLTRLSRLLEGFESAHALEVLATVDYLRHNKQADTPERVITEAAKWSERKRDMLQPYHVEVALAHLAEFAEEGGLFG